MTKPVISWNTSKVQGGFRYHVYSIGYQLPTLTLKEGVVPTRAMATLRARRWCLIMKRRAV